MTDKSELFWLCAENLGFAFDKQIRNFYGSQQQQQTGSCRRTGAAKAPSCKRSSLQAYHY